jgi:RNA polymerase-binding protein DksA
MTLSDAKAGLEDQLVELQARQQRVRSDLATPLPSDSSDRAAEMEDDAGLEAEARTIAQEIASVRRALTRIHDGSYGICVQCGEKITQERLLARPEAALCIGCARRL